MKPSSCTWGAVVAGALLVASGSARAENAANLVSGVQVEPGGEATRVVVETGQPPRFTLFKLTAPMRVVIDIQDADVTGVDGPIAGAGLVDKVTATQFEDAGGRIGRVVVALKDGARYDVRAEGKSVVLTASADQVGEPRPAAPRAELEVTVPPLPASKPAKRLLAIETRRGDDSTMLKLRTDGEPLRYEVKEVEDPPRLVVDLFGVKTKLRRPTKLDHENFEQVRIGKHYHKTRVVIDIAKGIPVYNVAAAEDGLTLALTDRLQPHPDGHKRDENSADDGVARVEDVQVTQEDGFIRLKVKVDGSFKERIASDAPRMKILEFRGRLPEALAKTTDATELGGPVRRVSAFTDPDNPEMVRLAADLSGEVEHKMWRKGDQLFWDFREQAAPPAPAATAAAGFASQSANAAQAMAPAARRYQGKRITLDVKDADILNVLRLISDVSKVNIIASDNVTGKVTIKLRNVPWDQALDMILKVKGLGMEPKRARPGGVVRVAPLTVLQQEEELALKRRQTKEKRIPTSVRLLVVNYASAEELLPQVEQILSERGKASVDARTNVIVVEDIKDNLIQAERLVRTLDTQTPQVLIETRIVEATTSFVRDLGVQWGGDVNFSSANGNPTGLVFPNSVGVLGAANDPAALTAVGGTTTGQPLPPNHAVNYPASIGGPGSTALGMTFGSIGNMGTLNLRLSAAESEGTAKVISAPKVVTMDNKVAMISQGVDIPVETISAAGTQTQLISAALMMEVTPHVTTDGSVLMKIMISNNVPNFSRNVRGVPTIEKKEAQTEVLLDDGATSVIGGIYTRRANETYKYTPFLGKIPLLGWMFKSHLTEDERRELLAFITPHIVNRRQASVNVSGN